jgi:hypothetical protein
MARRASREQHFYRAFLTISFALLIFAATKSPLAAMLGGTLVFAFTLWLPLMVERTHEQARLRESDLLPGETARFEGAAIYLHPRPDVASARRWILVLMRLTMLGKLVLLLAPKRTNTMFAHERVAGSLSVTTHRLAFRLYRGYPLQGAFSILLPTIIECSYGDQCLTVSTPTRTAGFVTPRCGECWSIVERERTIAMGRARSIIGPYLRQNEAGIDTTVDDIEELIDAEANALRLLNGRHAAATNRRFFLRTLRDIKELLPMIFAGPSPRA